MNKQDLALDEASMSALAHRTTELQEIKAARTETLKNLGLKIQVSETTTTQQMNAM
jgi:predicted amino acid-binding ACT domain protein